LYGEGIYANVKLRFMAEPPGSLKVVITERTKGHDPERLMKAFSLLVSEEDFVAYFRNENSDHEPPVVEDPST
jgi:hypothetical protein